jgi:thiol-disulfide isomerase/thioredoxin
MAVGLIVCVAALAIATAAGLTWRQRNGRMRPVAAGRASASRASVARESASRASAGRTAPGQALSDPAAARTDPGGTDAASVELAGAELAGLDLGGTDLGGPLGSRATLVQFSSAFCAPCRATRRVLAEVAGMTDGVAHLEIDAESHLELVRRLDVRRTPTVFVLGPDGRIAHRASGQPRKADVIAALGEVT